MQQGDAPYFKSLADKYAMSDNFHQSVNGGTGANHIMFGHGDAIWFSDGNGHPLRAARTVRRSATGTPDAGTVDEIENPNPAPGTNNWYTEDGYGRATTPAIRRPIRSRRSTAAGPTAIARIPPSPASAPILSYLAVAAKPINPRCEPGHYYLLNNYNPG